MALRAAAGRLAPPPLRPARAAAARRAARRAARAAAAKPAPRPAVSHVHVDGELYHPTSVPLLQQLEGLPLRAAAAQGASLIAALVGGGLLVHAALRAVDARLPDLRRRVAGVRSPAKMLAAAAVLAAREPADVLLWWYVVLEAMKVVVALGLASKNYVANVVGAPVAFVEALRSGFEVAVQLCQDAGEIILISSAAWFVIALKRSVVEWALARAAGTADGDATDGATPSEAGEELKRLLEPVSTLVTWVIVFVAAAASLVASGVNVQVFLAVGSVGSLSLALASQGVVSNVVSALSLYLLRPFIAGDVVALKTLQGQTLVARARVEKILPLNSTLVLDDGAVVILSNKDIAALVVVNESRARRSRAAEAAAVPGSPAAASPDEALDAELELRYADVERVAAAEAAAARWLAAQDSVRRGSVEVALQRFGPRGPVLRARAALAPRGEGGPAAAAVRSELLLGVERAMRRGAGALLAAEGGGAPPAPRVT